MQFHRLIQDNDKTDRHRHNQLYHRINNSYLVSTNRRIKYLTAMKTKWRYQQAEVTTYHRHLDLRQCAYRHHQRQDLLFILDILEILKNHEKSYLHRLHLHRHQWTQTNHELDRARNVKYLNNLKSQNLHHQREDDHLHLFHNQITDLINLFYQYEILNLRKNLLNRKIISTHYQHLHRVLPQTNLFNQNSLLNNNPLNNHLPLQTEPWNTVMILQIRKILLREHCIKKW